jgi:hypothetical protein
LSEIERKNKTCLITLYASLQSEPRSNKPFTTPFVEKALGGCPTAGTKQAEKQQSLKKRGKTYKANQSRRCEFYSTLAAAGVMAAAVGFAGCSPKQTDPVLAVNPDTIKATISADTYTVEVTSTATWFSEINAAAISWCSLSPDWFVESKAITVSVAANETHEPRSATITFTSGTLKKLLVVNQAGGCRVLVRYISGENIPSIVYTGVYDEGKVPVAEGAYVTGADATNPSAKGGKYTIVCQ